jgi:hypothetical protein
VDGLGDDVRDEQSSTAQELDGAGQAFEGAEKSELESAASTAGEGWNGLAGDVQQETDQAEQAATGLYQSWQSDAEGTADGFMDQADTLLSESAQAVDTHGGEIAAKAEEVGTALVELDGEGGQATTVFEFGAGASESLTPVVTDLAVAQQKAEEIATMLDELG